MPKIVRIIGVGNPLMGDDGVGIAVVERLQGLPLPPGVEAVDGGTGGLTLLHLMEGATAVILVDAAEMGELPGTLRRFGLDEVSPEANDGLSLHQAGLGEVFALGRELELLPPRLFVLGVQPESVEQRIGLSPSVEAALSAVVAQVLAAATEVQRESLSAGFRHRQPVP